MFCLHCGKEIPQQSTFCMACGKAIHAEAAVRPTSRQSPDVPKKESAFRSIGLIFLALLGVCLIFMFVSNATHDWRANPSSPIPAFLKPAVPHIEKLTSGQVTVKAGTIYYVRFKVDTAMMRSVRVVGDFRVSGGSGNDIQAAIVDEANFENWKNGHEGRALYSTGKTTVGNINVPIYTSGTYFLGFSNKFSAFTEKFIYGDIELRYTVTQ